MIAAKSGILDICQELVKAGSNANLQDKDGWSALMVAANYGHEKVVELLLKAGATLDIVNKEGDTALWMAVAPGHARIVDYLIAAGADLDLGPGAYSPLSMAVLSNQPELVSKLIGAGANADYSDDSGFSPLLFSIGSGYVECFQLLLDAGATPQCDRKTLLAALVVLKEERPEAFSVMAETVMGLPTKEKPGIVRRLFQRLFYRLYNY